MTEQTIGDFAKTYETTSIRNISELKEVDTNVKIESREAVDREGKPFKYKVIIVEGVEFRVPNSVLGSLKAILEKKPNLKKFSVSRTGKDKDNTKYVVIPMD